MNRPADPLRDTINMTTIGGDLKQVVFGKPTKSGNGFTGGKIYVFNHVGNQAYETYSDSGHRRVECYPFGEHSPHLWDGCGIYEIVAGRFEEVDP